METKSKTELVKFRGEQMICPVINNEPYVLAKSIIDGIGLNYNTAIENLKNNDRLNHYLVEWFVGDSNLSDDAINNLGLTKFKAYTLIPVRKVASWLYSINANKVNSPAKEVLIAFQDKCDDVLFFHFFGQKEIAKNYFAEKTQFLHQKRLIDSRIKELRTKISDTEEGKELKEAENELRNVKAQLQRLEQKQFGAIYSLFEHDENAGE